MSMAHDELTVSLSPSHSLSGAQPPCVFKTYKSSKSFADHSRHLFPAASLPLQLCFELSSLPSEHTAHLLKKYTEKNKKSCSIKTAKIEQGTCRFTHTVFVNCSELPWETLLQWKDGTWSINESVWHKKEPWSLEAFSTHRGISSFPWPQSLSTCTWPCH